MEWVISSHLVFLTLFALLVLALVPILLACAVVALTVCLYRVGIKGNSAPLTPERRS